MEPFVVLAGRRSGTTLLVESLDSHPDIECTKDVFSIRRRWKYFQVDVATGLFYPYRSASLERRIAYVFRRRRLIEEFLTETFARAGAPQARGIRLSYEQVRKYPHILTWMLKQNIRVLHLIRENSLKAIVSHFTAKKRGIAHATTKVEKVTLRLPPAELKRHLAQRAMEVERYRRLLQDRPCCEMSYESFLENREAETRRILEFLRVPRFVPLTSRLVKQNSDSLKEIDRKSVV